MLDARLMLDFLLPPLPLLFLSLTRLVSVIYIIFLLPNIESPHTHPGQRYALLYILLLRLVSFSSKFLNGISHEPRMEGWISFSPLCLFYFLPLLSSSSSSSSFFLSFSFLFFPFFFLSCFYDDKFELVSINLQPLPKSCDPP